MPQSPISVHAVLVAMVMGLHPVAAISSRDCKHNVKKAWQQYQGGGKCREPLCGAFDDTKLHMPFLDKLSDSCRTVMERYRVAPGTVTATDPSAPNGRNPCSTSKRAWGPTSPVVVETPFTNSFIMCTVPKVACSSFRKLLNTIIRSPDPAEASTWDQIMSAHFDYYPTVFHYRAPEHHHLSQTHPSFILGRSPYVRVLSGFLNKMVFDPNVKEPHDMFNFHDTNRALGRPEGKQFWPTRESFTKFLRLLEKRGTVDINDHFMRAGLVCDGGRWPYEFYLRLEDMGEWFPCWESALGLQGFTRHGWLTTPEGKKHDGVSSECWWKPPGVSCEDYYAKATAPDGTAQPVFEKFVAAEKHDEHDTKASEKWRKFYTQETGDLLYRLYKEDFELWGYEREMFDS